MLPKEFGFGSGVTCWRRHQGLATRRVCRRLHRVLLDDLGRVGLIDWSRGLDLPLAGLLLEMEQGSDCPESE